MKNRELRLMFAGLFLCAASMPVFAQEKTREELKLEAGAEELDKNHSEGQARVAAKIKAEFSVAEGLILGLRYKKMGYGEIAIALSLAQGMHRGITDSNLHKIVTLRQGPPVTGWGKIAKDLGLKLGPVTAKIKKLSAEVRRQEKVDKIKEAEITAAEKIEKAKKPEKDGKPARPENTAKAGLKSMVKP